VRICASVNCRSRPLASVGEQFVRLADGLAGISDIVSGSSGSIRVEKPREFLWDPVIPARIKARI
jgi:hypothetical protein